MESFHYTQERKKYTVLHLSLHGTGWTGLSTHSWWDRGWDLSQLVGWYWIREGSVLT